METIIYQDQGIRANKVNYIDGSLSIASLPTYDITHEGEEDLFRDYNGWYYLRRWLQVVDSGGDTERRASGRVLIHRVSVRAAC